MGLDIFLHSIRMVLARPREALRISGILYVLSLVIAGIGLFLLQRDPPAPGEIPWMTLLGSLVTAFLYIWTAVGWHRYVLLDEAPEGVLPPFQGDRMLAYLGSSLLLGLILIVLGVVLSFVISGVTMAAGGTFAVVLASTMVLLALLLVIGYRLAPMMPGAAVDDGQSIGAAWAATSGATGSFVVLAILSVLAGFLIDLPVYVVRLLPLGDILALVWLAITGWLKLMVGISILTTIYGHFVEKRPIG